LKKLLAALVCSVAPGAFAQVGGYMGPGVLTRGASDIGTRSGQQMDLRFYADLTGIYDTGLQPYSVDSKGNLVTINGLYGMELDLGAYGQHQWRQALLGLDYRGNFYHYENAPTFDGTTHNLTLGYTYQKSRRLAFDFRELAGTSSLAYGFTGPLNESLPTNFVGQPTSILFDNRIYYIQSTMDVNFILSPRTVLTAGGDGYLVRRQAAGLAGLNGYTLRGAIRHRLTRTRTIGATYEHIHFDFPPAYGQSDVNMLEGMFATALSKRWTFNLAAGVFQSEVQGVEQISLDPVVAALLGQSSGFQAFYKANYFPSGSADLTGTFRRYTVSLSYAQTVTPGNGVYLTSRQQSGTASYSYTALKRWNLGANFGYYTLLGIGQGLQPYSTYSGGAGFTYSLTRAIQLVGHYDARHQDITAAGFRQTGYRASFGIAFSPGDVPLSLW